MKNNFLQEMQDRGFLNQCTNIDKLDEICDKKSISGYIGFDCTASSLHVGVFANNDFKINAKTWSSTNSLLGGGTTLIGDPSGKDSTRKILEKEIKNNIQSIKKVFNKILDTSNKKTALYL
jgi:tyrosyl-tRNA synthetase